MCTYSQPTETLPSRSHNRAAQQWAMTGKQFHDGVVQRGRQLIQKANKSVWCIFLVEKAFFLLVGEGLFPNHCDFSRWDVTYA